MMDRNWMNLHRQSVEYKEALDEFLDDYFAKTAIGEQVSCPCKKCKRRFCYSRDDVYDHLIVDGFVKGFIQCISDKEQLFSVESMDEMNDEHDGDHTYDDIDGLLHDTFKGVFEGNRDEPNEEATKFFRLVEDGNEELYPGCKKFSRLSFVIQLYDFKCRNGVTNVAFNELLELLREAFPDAKLPKSFHEGKNKVRDLGLDYKKIHACPNDCILYWKEHEKDDYCHECGASRWKYEGVPVKVLRHFPLKPRLQRMFMCPETAKSMVWHNEERPKDGNLRHPADAKAWKDFDSRYHLFAQEPRNVRLGLASDGFNPFRTMSVTHSTWPVILINYNLPPSMCMKPEYFLLSLLIPGPSSPGNDIDIYLEPLIVELKDLLPSWHPVVPWWTCNKLCTIFAGTIKSKIE